MKNEQAYRARFDSLMPELVLRLFRLYGSRADFHELLSSLAALMKKSFSARSDRLVARDGTIERDPDWFLEESGVGMMLYVDLFAGDFSGLAARIPDLVALGISYVHLMPLYRAPESHNDGGYAVSSYRDTDQRLGSIEGLEELSGLFHDSGISLVLDFVFNHTSDEHEWALAARRGETAYRDFYFIYPDKADADDWNRTLREIFPDTRRGSFTFVEEAGGWVWTTFNSFQWDLNYSNPAVFLAMCGEMLYIANLGVDVLRLDALAFVWKRKGTNCENLEEAHLLIQAFQFVAAIAAPALAFKSEAIVHPDEVIKYIGRTECRLSYNPLQMALFWEAIATRDARLLRHSLGRRWWIPEGTGWVNYIRCHDDIGWTFSDEDAAEIGINGHDHRHFLNLFYTGRFPGSFARGEAFQLNPETGDCRVCGTMASLCGLEEAAALHVSEDSRAELYGDMAIARMLMMYAVLLALPGIPLLYAGDESALLNDASWKDDPVKATDSRWVHRIALDPSRKKTFLADKEVTNDKDTWLIDKQARVFSELSRMIKLRKHEPSFGKTGIGFFDPGDAAVFAFRRDGGKVTVMANFSERAISCGQKAARAGRDLIAGMAIGAGEEINLGPYQVRWIKEIENEGY